MVRLHRAAVEQRAFPHAHETAPPRLGVEVRSRAAPVVGHLHLDAIGGYAMRTLALALPACFTTLVSASWMMR